MKKFKFFSLFLLFIAIYALIGPSVKADSYFDEKYYTEVAPSGYYDSLDTSKTDDAFRRELSAIISKGYKQHSYSANNTVLKYTDPDPKHPGNIICFYTGESMSSGWNKEHVWAKSHGFPESGYSSSEPYSDAHHLRPTETKINSSRGNSDFGEVTGGKSDSYGNKWTGSMFEPRDEVKGDVARIMFYMATRYGYGQFALKLVEQANTSGSSLNGRFGGLNTLLKWHYEDPVSKEEIYRNNVIYDNYQHNRNPYIDHPEWVDLAYPNNYSSSEPDQNKVDNVISLIASLPDVPTLNDEAKINAAYSAYNALNSKEKALVVNYQRLVAIKSALDSLKEPTVDPIDPVGPSEGDVVVDFKNHGVANTNYQANLNFEIGDKEFNASYGGVYGGELRIGGNKSDTSLAKYNIDGNGVILEPKFSVKNASSLEINVSSNYGTPSHYYVLFKNSSGSINQIADGNYSEKITASLATPQDGSFILIITGSGYPRLVLNNYIIKTAKNTTEEIDYSKYNTEASIIGEVKNNELTLAMIRFGGKFDSSIFADASDFGVIVMKSDELGNDKISSYYNGGNATSFIASIIETGFKCSAHSFKDDKAIVDGKYQFGLVIDNCLGHEKEELTAVIYIEKNNKVYFMNQTSTSFIKVLSDMQVDSTEALIKDFILSKFN